MSIRGPKRGSTLNGQARELVVKLHAYFERESQNDGPLLPVTQVMRRVGEALGIGKRTVGKIVNEKYGPSGCEDNPLCTPNKRIRKKLKTVRVELDTEAIKNQVSVEPVQPGYVDSKDWDFDSVMRLLALIRDTDDAAPARMAIRRALQPSRGLINEQESFKLFPALRKQYHSNLCNDIKFPEEEVTSSSTSSSFKPSSSFDENAVLVISNPVKARLPSAQIRIKQLKEIMENRARELREMPTTKRPTTKPMKRKQASTTKTIASAVTAIKSEVITIKIEDDGQPTTTNAETNGEVTTTIAPAE